MLASALLKYGEMRLPRYTSYPTAPRFAAAVDEQTYGAWLKAIPKGQDVSLYLHIPFCRSMCWYCGCHTTITKKDDPILDYLDVLRDEIRMVADTVGHPLPVAEVHFGGGTPTIIEPREFLALMTLMRERFALTPSTNVAVEIDPRRLTLAMAEALGEGGVRRASLGVQSFDPDVLRALGRIHSPQEALETVAAVKAGGFDNYSIDLMYGLPGQSLATWEATLRQAVALDLLGHVRQWRH